MTHYKLYRQKEHFMKLSGEDAELSTGSPGGAVARDPEKELLSYVVNEMNSLFEGELSSDDMLNYARTLKDKMAENQKVIEQVEKNSQEQAMMGGFVDTMIDAVVENMDSHQNIATQVLNEDKIAKGLASILYKMLKDGMKKPYAINNEFGLDRVAEENEGYGLREAQPPNGH
jgi:type I restriction enzyme R subunit